ncbi:ABC transporter permease subunit [Streptomyces racemochromogenes]|uniref:ABC transporter permease subunit n=1 Tax=Streptomyces racemochromogenes TaxID=67353 RepID=A0ABW7PLW2_9ACTN
MASFPAVLRSEWTKIRTVASTTWTLASALVVTVGLGALLCSFTASRFTDMTPAEKLTFDPIMISFAGMSLGQLAMIVFGVLVVGTEYGTGMIRTSLAAVPRRGSLLLGKLTAATALALAVGLATSFLSFFLGQAILGDHGAGLGREHALRAVIGAGLYMALIALFSMGVTTVLRSSILALGILMPFFFLISNILHAFASTRKVAQYFPDQAGSKIMETVPDAVNQVQAPYGPWGGLGIMLLWVLAAVAGGYLVLRKRDA